MNDCSVGKQSAAPIVGIVESFDEDEGWGVLIAPDLPSGCFVHFSNIEMEGYRRLRAGQKVRFTYEEPGFLQDGYPYRAVQVWTAN